MAGGTAEPSPYPLETVNGAQAVEDRIVDVSDSRDQSHH